MEKIVAALKALPLIRFALMLGGGVMASIAAGMVQAWLAYGQFPDSEAVWLARIHGVTWMGLAATAIVAVVMVTLAWGKASGVKLTKGDATAELSFEDDDK
jgi:hypothetical protein